MRTKKRQIRELRKSIAVLLVFLLAFSGVVHVFALGDGGNDSNSVTAYVYENNDDNGIVLKGKESGNAIWTTDQYGNPQNQQEYPTKKDVYIRFGSGISEGLWLVEVSNSSGQDVLGSGTVNVTPGLWYNIWTITGGFGSLPKNGVYKVTATQGSESKTDTFKAGENPPELFLLTLESNPASGGTTTGAGSYEAGSSVSVTASASSGYQFVNWTQGQTIVSTNANFNYTMPSENVTLTANFKPLYTLTLESNPTAGGTTSGGGTFTEGDTADITATANQGFSFVNWTRGGTEISTNSSHTYTMPGENVTLTANFRQIPNSYTVTLESNPENVGTLTGAGAYLEGASVDIEAKDYDGYKFVDWTIKNAGQVSEIDSFSHTMLAADITFVANFVPIYELTLEAEPEDGGTVSDGGFFEAEEEINVEAVSNEGFVFVNWTDEGDNVVSEEASFKYTMPHRDVTLTANFVAIYELTLKSNPEAGGTTSGEGFYAEGEEVELTAVANPGFTFLNWTYEGDEGEVEVSDEAIFKYTMPGQDMTLTANFEADPETFILTITSSPSAGGSTTGEGAYVEGTEVPVSATAAVGYTFINWTRGEEVVSTNPSFIYTMPGENVTLAANFEEEVIPIIVTPVTPPPTGPTGGGGGTPATITTFTIPIEPVPLGAPVIEDEPIIILDQPVPLAPPSLPQTGDTNPVHYLLAGALLAMAGYIFRRRVTA